MQQTFRPSTILIFVLAIAALTASCVQNQNDNSKIGTLYRNSPTPAASPETSTEIAAAVTPSPAPQVENSPASAAALTASPTATAALDNTQVAQNPAAAVTPAQSLMIPVVGVQNKDLTDTFTQARSGGRVHDAIDIMAAGGTPVVAATDGKLVEFFDSVLGGITIYQISQDEKTVYYYAHLQRRADGVKKGDTVKQGTLIGYVGETGNAGAGNTHLHFAISLVSDPKKIHDGAAINPYPLPKNAKTAAVNSQQ